MEWKKVVTLVLSFVVLISLMLFAVRTNSYVVKDLPMERSPVTDFFVQITPLLLGFILAIITVLMLWVFERVK